MSWRPGTAPKAKPEFDHSMTVGGRRQDQRELDRVVPRSLPPARKPGRSRGHSPDLRSRSDGSRMTQAAGLFALRHPRCRVLLLDAARRATDPSGGHLAATSKGIEPRVLPHLAAIAAKPAELNIAMPVVGALEDEDEFVLPAVQRAHSAIVLDPDAEFLSSLWASRPAASSSSIWRQPIQMKWIEPSALKAAMFWVA